MKSQSKVTIGSYPSEFFKTIYDGYLRTHRLTLEIRCIHSKSGYPVVRRYFPRLRELRAAWQELRRLNKGGYDIFFSVLPRDPKKQNKLPERLILTCLWSDIDVNDDKPNKSTKRILRHLRKLKIKPTIVVKSSHGIHAYWCFEKPITLEISEAKQLLRSLAENTGGDLQSAEAARLLRMPGTLNWKEKSAPKRCHVIGLRSNRRYRLSEFKKRFPANDKKHRKIDPQNLQDYFEFFSDHVDHLRKTSDVQAVGSCPFHKDRHPSWSLRLTDGVWHCFGCEMKGNAVSFCRLLRIAPTECPGEKEFHEHRAFAVQEGGYVIWRRNKRGWHKLRISDFVIEWNMENRVSDGIRLEDRLFDGQIVTKSKERVRIRISNNEFCSNLSFYEALIRECGSKIWLNAQFAQYIREASLLFSRARILKTNMDFGFQDEETFLTPTLRITPKGIRKATETQIDLESIEHARHLDLKIVGKTRRKQLLEHICNDLLKLQPHKVTYPLLGLVGASPLMHFIEDKTRYALWVVGPSGSGKSFIAKLFQSFFGDFTAEGRVASWSSTINSLQYLGYFFKDCIFLLDDYKPAMVRNEGSVVQFLQTYADFYARSRLTSEIKSRKDYYVRGLLLTTGEDVPAGHASVVARSLILSINKREPDLNCGNICLGNCANYPAITSSYIRYLLRRKNLRSLLSKDLKIGHEMFLRGIEREENSVRIARNLALNRLGFKWITRFLRAAKAPIDVKAARKEHKRNLLELRTQMLNLISQEQPAQVFIEALSEVISNGTSTIRDASKHYGHVRGRDVVGFEETQVDSYVYIFPPEAMAVVRAQVQRLGRRFDWTPNAVSKALKAAGYLVRSAKSQDSALRKRVGKKIYRVWQLRKDCLGLTNESDETK